MTTYVVRECELNTKAKSKDAKTRDELIEVLKLNAFNLRENKASLNAFGSAVSEISSLEYKVSKNNSELKSVVPLLNDSNKVSIRFDDGDSSETYTLEVSMRSALDSERFMKDVYEGKISVSITLEQVISKLSYTDCIKLFGEDLVEQYRILKPYSIDFKSQRD